MRVRPFGPLESVSVLSLGGGGIGGVYGAADHDEAVAIFDRLLTLRSDLGLLSEEYDPRYGRQVGNTPQAFSHVPLIQAALNLGGHATEYSRRHMRYHDGPDSDRSS